MGAVKAVLALAQLAAGLPRVVALAVLLLALGFPAVAVFSIRSIHRAEGETMLISRYLLRLPHRLGLCVAVRAVATVALVSTHLSRGKTFAVHLQAPSLFAVAACSFLGAGRDRR